MKKRFSKNIFHFSNLINALKKETRKKNNFFFLNLFWFKTNFKKQKSKFSDSFFYFKSKNEFQKVLSFFNFCYEIEKWKIKFLKSKKRIILLGHGLKMKIKMNSHFCFHFDFNFCFCFCFLKVFAFLLTPRGLEVP